MADGEDHESLRYSRVTGPMDPTENHSHNDQ